MKISAILASAGIMLAVLSGCGGDSEPASQASPEQTSNSAKAPVPASNSPYCGLLASTVEEHLSDEDADIADFGAAMDALTNVASAAPEAVSAEWVSVTGTLNELVQALDQLGLTFDDLDRLFVGEVPEGSQIDPTEAVEALEPVFAAATSGDLVQAQAKIQEHAKSECNIDLDLGISPDA